MSFKFLNESIITNKPIKHNDDLLLECITESARADIYLELLIEAPDESRLKKVIEAIKKFFIKIWNFIKRILGIKGKDTIQKVEKYKKDVDESNKSPEEIVKDINEDVETTADETIEDIADKIKTKINSLKKENAEYKEKVEILEKEIKSKKKPAISKEEMRNILKRHRENYNLKYINNNEKVERTSTGKIKVTDWDTALNIYMHYKKKFDLKKYIGSRRMSEFLIKIKRLLTDKDGKLLNIDDKNKIDILNTADKIIKSLDKELNSYTSLEDIVSKISKDMEDEYGFGEKLSVYYLYKNDLLTLLTLPITFDLQIATEIMDILSDKLDNHVYVDVYGLLSEDLTKIINIVKNDITFLNKIIKDISKPLEDIIVEENVGIYLSEFVYMVRSEQK